MTKIDEEPDDIPDTDDSREESEHPEPLAPMTFNMPRAWHTRFKLRAVERGMNMKELMLEIVGEWEEKQAKK
ncbi:hypothetical protein [Sulfitobacter sp. D7]|jgi:hypothetical protein|uniref:hypothetical protein n=1 Tax=Sulfitobacter sp. D7 TaxID=1968541 RepID=UPI000E77B64C|nr:hypothetical protein [Sulfitobacter sp. D7]AYE85278.1 hypothetical protein B5M07_03625 [Sulfitobacter sp. D7]